MTPRQSYGRKRRNILRLYSEARERESVSLCERRACQDGTSADWQAYHDWRRDWLRHLAAVRDDALNRLYLQQRRQKDERDYTKRAGGPSRGK